MTTTADLLAGILDPATDCDDLRLVLADLLEEEGETERAEFIRCQIEAERLEAAVRRWVHTPHDQPGGSAEDGGPAGAALAQSQALRRRERELWDAWASTPASDDPAEERQGPFGPLAWRELREQGWGIHLACDAPACPISKRLYVARGFVHAVTLAPADLSHLDAILACQPVREVALTTWPEYNFEESGRTRFVGRRRDHWIPRGERHDHSRRGITETLLRAEWPTVQTWHLPERAPV